MRAGSQRLLSIRFLKVPLEDDQIFLHIGELQYVTARQQGKSAAQAYYLPSKVRMAPGRLL
jgi:hypothetical protein